MMKNLLILFSFLGCSSTLQDSFNSIELISSKGERIYINSLNWGVTDDSQITLISSNKDRLKNRSDIEDVEKGLEPFFYSFRNDSLKLFFNGEVSYKLKEHFKTINVSYFALSGKEYNKIRQKAYNNDAYYSVPRREKTIYPPNMPKAPPK